MPPRVLAFPLRAVRGRFATVEQDDAEHITQRAEIVLHYPKGFRPDAPTFGTSDQAFTSRVDVEAVREDVLEFVPEVDITVTSREEWTDLAVRVRDAIRNAASGALRPSTLLRPSLSLRPRRGRPGVQPGASTIADVRIDVDLDGRQEPGP